MISIFKKIFGGGEPDCAEILEGSSDYLDAELPPPKMAAFQAHLSKCAPCRAFVETLASTIGLLSGLPRVTAPPTFKQSIIERARQEGRQ